MVQLRWRAVARLSVSGPADWAPVERVEVHHRSGEAVVRVENWPVSPDAVLEAVASAHAAEWAAAGKQCAWQPATVLGHDGLTHSMTTENLSGHQVTATVSYALDRGRAYAVTQVVPTGDPDRAEETAAIVGSVSIAAPLDVEPEQLPLRGTDGVDFTAIGQAWQGSETPVLGPTYLLTLEESFAVARRYGVAMLPGTDTTQWGLLDAAQRELASAVAWRSLVARGATTDPDLRQTLEIAASHDLLLVVTTGTGERSGTAWYAVRADRAAKVTIGEAAGTICLSNLATTALADVVITDQEGQDTRASCVYRHDGRIVGQEISWCADAAPGDMRTSLATLLPTSAMDRGDVR